MTTATQTEAGRSVRSDWSNHETWTAYENVAGTTKGKQHWIQRAASCWGFAYYNGGGYYEADDREQAIGDLAGEMKEAFVERLNSLDRENPEWITVVETAARNANWREIAESFVEQLDAWDVGEFVSYDRV